MREKGETQSRITQIDKGSMRRVLGVGDLFAVGYGDLGSSIYYALGITALHALGATPMSLVLAGLIFACTALSYAELSSMLSDAGGSASFARHAFNDLISFIAGWGLLLDFIVTIAISSYSISSYLAFFFDFLSLSSFKIGFSVCVIAILFVVNFFGIKESARISGVLTTLTLSTQIFIVIVGTLWFVQFPDLWEHLKIGVKGSNFSPAWPEFWRGTAMAMVAYTGIESMTQLSAEAKNPSKTVPKAMMLAMGMLLFVYIGLAIVALSALTPQVLSTQFLENPIAGIVSKLPYGGGVLGGWIGLLAAVILFVAANAGLIGASRLAFNMGENYQLPRTVYRLHKQYKTPFISLAIFSILAIGIVVASRGKLSFLADLYNFGAMLAFFMTHLSLIFLRIRYPEKKRLFKVPLNLKVGGYLIPIPAILGGLATAATWCLVVWTKLDGRYLGCAWLLLGLAMYFYYRHREEIDPAGKIEIHKIKIPEFRVKQYQNILVSIQEEQEIQTVQMASEIAKLHGAHMTAVHVVEVPFSLSLDSPYRVVAAESILKRAEAIGREFNMRMALRIIQARRVDAALLKLVAEEGFDLIVMGESVQTRFSKRRHSISENLLKTASCSIWIGYIHPTPKKPDSPKCRMRS